MSGAIVVSSFTKGGSDNSAPYTTLQTFFTNFPGSKTLPNGSSINIGGVPAWFMTYNLASDVIAVTGSGAPVTFTRSGGTYVASGSSFTISESIPTAPTALTLDSKNGNSVTISFTQSTAGILTRPVTNYRFSINNGSSYQLFSPADAISPVTISGLTPGVAYPIKLKGVNAIGDSLESSVLTVTPSGVPNAPTGVTPNPTGVNSEFTILWSAPGSNGGAIITKYRIKGYLASNNSYLGFTETVSATPTSITITSLTSDPGPGTYTFINGTNYYFRVEAFNENGYSSQSTSSGSNSPYGPPGTVSNINLTRGNQEVALTWDAADANGRMITQYEITSTPATTTQYSFTSPKTFTGLTNGTSYTFSIRASNGVYGSSVTSGSIIPATTPSAPTFLAVDTNTGSSLTINFTEGSDGGNAITNYKYSLDNGSSYTTFSPSDITSPVTISSGLISGTTYNIKLRAINDLGDGAESDALSVRMNSVPDAPTGLTVDTNAGSSLTISFTPGFNGGFEFLNYKYSINNGSTYTAFSPAETTSPVTITGLSEGVTYDIKLRAVNDLGDGVESSGLNVRTNSVPDAPTGLAIDTNAGSSLTISFIAGFDGGASITNYKYSINNGSTYTAFSPAETSSPVTITGLSEGVTYDIKLRGVNDIGDGIESSGLNVRTNSVPDAPTSLSVDDNKGTYLVISFTTPVSDGGSAITNYKYSLNDGSSFIAFSPSDTSSPVTITGLTQNTSYDIKLRGVNTIGDGIVSSTLTVLTDRVPDVPTNFSGVAGNGEVSLTWTASAFDGGETIDFYRVTNTTNTTFEDVSGVTSLVYTGLTNGTPYSFTVKAHNSIGFSGTISAGPYQPYIYSNPQLYPRPLVEDKAVQLWWEPPAFPGPLVSAYEITCPSPSVFIRVGSNVNTTYITGLSTNTEYTFTVNTKIASLSTVGSAIFTGITTGNQPGNITDLSGELNGYLGATITWTPTVDDGGSPIKHQVVYAYCFDQSGNSVSANDIKQSYWSYTTTAYVYPFQEGYVYNVQVQAVNDCGYSINPPQITFNTF